MFLEKYSLRVDQKMRGKKVRVVFSSFIHDAQWAITNMKTITGCAGFTGFDSKTQTCSKCLAGSYF